MSEIEEALGSDWPKALYPHGGGREWSTSTHNDQWKKSLGFDVVPSSQLEAAVEALAEVDVLINEVLDQWTWPIRTYGDMRGWLASLSDAVKRGQGHPALASPRNDQTKEDR